MPLRLAFLDPGSTRRRIVLVGGRLVIGSCPGPAGLLLRSSTLLPAHAEVEAFDGRQARVRSVSPEAAVFVNGRLRADALIGPGDLLQLGGVELRVIPEATTPSRVRRSGAPAGLRPEPPTARAVSSPAPAARPTAPRAAGGARRTRHVGAVAMALVIPLGAWLSWSLLRLATEPPPRPRVALLVTSRPASRDPRPAPTAHAPALGSSAPAETAAFRPDAPPPDMVRRSLSAVVGVLRASSLGSGFIVSAEGHMITNAHVVGQEIGIEVKLYDGRRLGARWTAEDRDADLALFRIEAPSDQSLPLLPLGSRGDMNPGATVYAMGFPLSETLAFTTTRGILSGLRTFDEGPESLRGRSFLQHDAAINPGNSGGPLLNVRGRVVGVNTWKIDYVDRIGFAVPVDAVQALMRKAGVSWTE